MSSKNPEPSAQSEELLRLVVENVEDFAIYTKGLDGRLLSWNPGVERLLGYREEEWVGRHISIIYTPEDVEQGALEHELETALAEGRAEDQRWHVRKDGSRFWANGLLMLLRDEAGRPRAFAKIMRDDTARKLAEEALLGSELRLRHLIHNIPGGSVNVFDRDLRYLFAAGRELAEVGLSPEALVGRTLAELFPTEAVEYAVPYYRRAFAGETVEFELEVGGQWYTLNAGPLDEARGETVSVIALAQNITARKELEGELRRARAELEERVAERTRELSELTGTLLGKVKEREAAQALAGKLLHRVVRAQELERLRVARDLHESVGQELTALRLNFDLLKRECAGRPELIERMGQTQEIARRVEAELDFIAWELRPAALDHLGLPAAVENFVGEWSKHYRIQCRFQAPGMGGLRLGPEAETNLYRIAQEALNNVYKHAAAARVSVVLERRDGRVVLIVEDDGRGFEPGGAVDGERGMGLLSMRERAEQVGGTLEIESAPGRGTTIFARVPARD